MVPECANDERLFGGHHIHHPGGEAIGVRRHDVSRVRVTAAIDGLEQPSGGAVSDEHRDGDACQLLTFILRKTSDSSRSGTGSKAITGFVVNVKF